MYGVCMKQIYYYWDTKYYIVGVPTDLQNITLFHIYIIEYMFKHHWQWNISLCVCFCGWHFVRVTVAKICTICIAHMLIKMTMYVRI